MTTTDSDRGAPSQQSSPTLGWVGRDGGGRESSCVATGKRSAGTRRNSADLTDAAISFVALCQALSPLRQPTFWWIESSYHTYIGTAS